MKFSPELHHFVHFAIVKELTKKQNGHKIKADLAIGNEQNFRMGIRRNHTLAAPWIIKLIKCSRSHIMFLEAIYERTACLKTG